MIIRRCLTPSGVICLKKNVMGSSIQVDVEEISSVSQWGINHSYHYADIAILLPAGVVIILLLN